MEKEAKEILCIFAFFVFAILLIKLVLAYPILDSGISYNFSEDTLYSYNLSQNVTYDPATETLTFSIDAINSSSHDSTTISDYDWISIESSNGNITFNTTNSNQTGNFTISIKVVNQPPSSEGTIVATYFNATAVNDAPEFTGLGNESFNALEVFEDIITVTDEEDNIPYVLNISFVSCDVAEWSTRNCSNSTGKELFSSSDYSFDSDTGDLNISFTPTKNDVGAYEINFSVMDNSSLGNQTTNQWVNYTVLNVNAAPYFRYTCDSEREATEDTEFTCWINVSDIDEINNITFSANFSWLTFNNSLTNSEIVTMNLTYLYNASAMINFTANDSSVGNWSVNISLTDTGGETGTIKMNSTTFWFFVNNTEDVVTLDVVNNYTVYENQTIYVNASDDDLFVPDSSVKDEVLTFDSNTSWVNITTFLTEQNYTTAKIDIDFDTISASGDANYTVKINVTDTASNFADMNFTIEILSDTAAVWNQSNYSIDAYEGNETYINFSIYVTDSEGDNLTFSFANDTEFFSLNTTTFNSIGIVNFTPIDEDVGYHDITINASDGKLDSLVDFNFTIYNINDDPVIQTPLQINADNASIDSSSNINASEDNRTVITFSIVDNDIKIPDAQIQSGFYNESLAINLTIAGPNTTLFNFTLDSTNKVNGLLVYQAIFTPTKDDVGSYNVTINVTDNGDATMGEIGSSYISFNITVFSVQHNPSIMNLTNKTSAVNRSFYYKMNASDTEDGDDTTGNLTFNITFLYGTDFINFNTTILNLTSGELNITFNDSQSGRFHLNVTVNDSAGSLDSDDFWIHVYSPPNVTFPSAGYNFTGVQENVSINLTFTVNHSIEDNLTYEIYIDSRVYNGTNFTYGDLILRNNESYYGNGTNFTWEFTPNFTEESYGEFKNLTLIVYPSSTDLANATDLNFTINFGLNITYSNSPINFSGYIGDKQSAYSSNIEINLSQYFSDVDYSDLYYNQNVSFVVTSNSSPSYITSSVSNWTLTLSSIIAVKEVLTINASDTNSTNNLTSVLSNEFEVDFTTPVTTIVTTPSSGGGGGTKPVSLKILLPDPISVYKKGRILVPITLINSGKVRLSGINLSAFVAKNNILRKDIFASFEQSYFSSLDVGEEKKVNLVIGVDTEELGLYEITINASVKSPSYNDWGKMYLTIKEGNVTEIFEKLVFTEEFIAENPECIEIREIIDEAKEYLEGGDYDAALIKSGEAIEACEYAIAQQALPKEREKVGDVFYRYLTIFSLGAFLLGISYYSYKKMRLRRVVLKE